MNYDQFQAEFLSKLKLKNKNILEIIENNKTLIQEYLGENAANPQRINSFVNEINNIILDNSNNNLITIIIDDKKNPFNNKYDLIEKVLNHSYFSKVLEVFTNSDILIRACKIGNKNAIKWLLTMNINPYVQDENGMSALIYAAQQNFDFVIKPFLRDSRCLNLEDKCGENVLFHCMRNQKFLMDDVANNNKYQNSLILDSDININHTNIKGESILIYCAKNNIIPPIKKFLLRHTGIDVNIADNHDKTAAMYLTEKGRYSELLELNKKSCNYDYINRYNESVMSILINKMYSHRDNLDLIPYENYIHIMNDMVNNQFDFNYPIDNDENTPFMVMLIVNDITTAKYCAKYLKKLDLSVKNKYGENATSLCYKLNHYDILPLFKKNPTYNYSYRDPLNQNTLLMISAINNPAAMKELLENEPEIINEVNAKNENALIIATKINKIKAVEILLERGINVNHQDSLGNTALHYALDIQSPPLIRLLMTKKPDVHLKNNEGKSPMDLATEINETETNRELLTMLSNPSGNLKTIKFSQPISTKYVEVIQNYTTPCANNDYPEYKPTTKWENSKKEIYKIKSGTFKTILIKIFKIIIILLIFMIIAYITCR